MKAIAVITGVLLALVAAGDGKLGAALIIGAVVLVVAARTRRAVAGHSHPGPLHLSARHEAGHMAAIRAVGGQVESARLRGDGSGLVTGYVPGTQEAVTVYLAGAVAAGTDRGADQDFADVERELAALPAADRGHVLRAARRDVDRLVRDHAGEIARDAALLQKHGRL